ncbi:MAG: YeeE/YedE family protein [Hyphomicrobiales bacterium]|nr:YeeE/YedE family protein [Hyphomicrobiales bacterium]
MRIISALLIGMIFGIGIAISGLANPAKVLNFFDVAGSWDPSLILVMGGALITTAIGYRLVFGSTLRPLLDTDFKVPLNTVVDRRLVFGSATFGIGWGISGFCPGGAIPALGFGYSETLLFVGAMIVGIILAPVANSMILKPARA